MRAAGRWIAISTVLLCSWALAGPLPSQAQAPKEPLFSGAMPPIGGGGFLVTKHEWSPAALVSALPKEGCWVEAMAVLRAGQWTTYIVGAPPSVNAGFPALGANSPFWVRCGPPRESGTLPPPSPTSPPASTPVAVPPSLTIASFTGYTRAFDASAVQFEWTLVSDSHLDSYEVCLGKLGYLGTCETRLLANPGSMRVRTGTDLVALPVPGAEADVVPGYRFCVEGGGCRAFQTTVLLRRTKDSVDFVGALDLHYEDGTRLLFIGMGPWAQDLRVNYQVLDEAGQIGGGGGFGFQCPGNGVPCGPTQTVPRQASVIWVEATSGYLQQTASFVLLGERR